VTEPRDFVPSTGSYAALKVNELPTNQRFVGIDNDFTDTNHYLELGGQLAALYHAAV
jgi:hypothetical protein